jgi:uncharacterized protein
VDPATLAKRLNITISDDRLTALLEVVPLPGACAPDADEALGALAAAQVLFGVNLEAVATALQNPGRPVVVAVGQPATSGADGRVEYASCVLTTGGRPHVKPDGDVDLFDLDLVRNVECDALLATCIPAEAGDDGTDVLGRPIAGRVGRPHRVRAGPGTRLSDDGVQVLAATAGHATLVDETISVSSIYRVTGDVGPATGHVDFVGSVTISGSVTSGFRVKAGGDVEIQGSLEGEVVAGGNVSVRYGIQGHGGRGHVEAGGTVRSRFIESAEVHAGDSVYASDGIMRSDVSAGRTVEVLGRHGAIVGGRIVAGETVSARDLGSPRSVPTEVIVGTAPTLVVTMRQVQERLPLVVQQLQQLQARITLLQGYDREGRLNQVGRDQLSQQLDAYRVLLDERTSLLTRRAELLELLQRVAGSVVKVEGTCFSATRVAIGNASYVVEHAWQGVRFRRNSKSSEIELVQA